MDDIVNQLNGIIPQKYLSLLTALFVGSQVLGRVFQSIRSGGGLRSIIRGIWFGTNVATPKQSTPPDQGIADKLNGWLLIGLVSFGLMFGATGCAWFNPQDLKPAPVAAGQDSVVVNAERIQETSLFAYKELIEWEFQNRAFLAADVSRAVDRVRREFPPQWRLSRKILSDYKAARGGDISNLNRINAALSAAQTAMLAFPGDNSDVPALFKAITSLSESISTLKAP